MRGVAPHRGFPGYERKPLDRIRALRGKSVNGLTNRTMHPELITAQLRICGQSSAHIAQRLGVSRALVSRVIRGSRSNARVQRAIARALALPVRSIFPTKTCAAAQIANRK